MKTHQCAAALFAAIAPAALAGQGATTPVFLNGEFIGHGKLINGRTYVPLTAITGPLGISSRYEDGDVYLESGGVPMMPKKPSVAAMGLRRVRVIIPEQWSDLLTYTPPDASAPSRAEVIRWLENYVDKFVTPDARRDTDTSTGVVFVGISLISMNDGSYIYSIIISVRGVIRKEDTEHLVTFWDSGSYGRIGRLAVDSFSELVGNLVQDLQKEVEMGNSQN